MENGAMNRIQIISLVLWTLFMMSGLVSHVLGDPQIETMSPDEVVARLTSLPHGLLWLDDEDSALLEAVKKEPAVYLPATSVSPH